jgi:hypothetical protein
MSWFLLGLFNCYCIGCCLYSIKWWLGKNSKAVKNNLIFGIRFIVWLFSPLIVSFGIIRFCFLKLKGVE